MNQPNHVTVRCWQFAIATGPGRIEQVLATYPEGNCGHHLIQCTACGQIYAADLSTEVYVGPPLAVQLARSWCRACNANLDESSVMYPEKFRNADGVVRGWTRPREYPDDRLGMWLEFPDLYNGGVLSAPRG